MPDQQRRARRRCCCDDVPVVVEGEAEDAELRERRLRLDEEADEEERDQHQDQRRERRSGPTAGAGPGAARAATARATERPPPGCVTAAGLHQLRAAAAAPLHVQRRRPWPWPCVRMAARQRRVLELACATLWPVAERVVQPVLHALASPCASTARPCTCPGRRAGTWPRRSGRPVGSGALIALKRRSAGTLRPSPAADVASSDRRDVLAGLVLHVGGREVVLQRVGLLDVADRALVLLDAGGDAVVALGAGAGRPLDRLVDAGAVLPRGRVVGEELGEAASSCPTRRSGGRP